MMTHIPPRHLADVGATSSEANTLGLIGEHSAAFGTLLAAAVAGIIAAWSIRNRRKADIKSEWWNRVQYAIEQCFSADTRRQNIGLEMLTVLGTGHPAGSRLERPHWWPLRLFLPARGHSTWVADKDDKKFLAGLLDAIVEAVIDRPTR